MAEKEEEIKEAIETLENISSDEQKERIAELRQKYIMDKKSEMRTAREIGLNQGLEEGIKKGIKEGKKEVAKKMKEKGLSINEIIEITGLEKEVKVARYHSLSLQEDTLPDCLKVTARADDGEIMAVEHKDYPVYGLQFHPESIMTPDGKKMLENFVRI